MKIWKMLLAGALLAACAACAESRQLEQIAGEWHYVDPHLEEVAGQSYLEHSWVFRGGRFTYEVCCLHEIWMSGYYRVEETREDYLVLMLYDITANEMAYEADQSIRISIDEQADTLRIGNGGPYERVSP
jgi:hypothetical protein